MHWRENWKEQKENGWTSCLESYGLIEQHPDDQWESLLSLLHMGKSHYSNWNWYAYCQNSRARLKGQWWRTHKTIGLGRWNGGNATIWITSYHQRAITQYNKRARPRFFQPGFLVLRRIFENIAEVGAGKLQANWEEPYVITKKETQGHTIFKR